MSDPNATAGDWAKSVAATAVDALVDAGLLTKAQFEAARDVVAEEVLVRLCVNDRPPPFDHERDGDALETLRRRSS